MSNKQQPSIGESGILYLLSMPIGNLKDISKRAMEILQNCDVILAEDTRNIALTLSKLPVKSNAKYVSYHKFNENSRLAEITSLLLQGRDIALVSDAGMPCISDPGYLLVKHLRSTKPHIKIVPVPGANAALTALVASGQPCEQFYFAGFIPKKSGDFEKLFAWWRDLLMRGTTVIAYEAPHRIINTLTQLSHDKFFAEVDLVIARELTKTYEEFLQGDALQLLAHFEQHPPRGEMVILLSLDKNQQVEQLIHTRTPHKHLDVDSIIKTLTGYDISDRDIVELCRQLLPKDLLPRKNRIIKLIREFRE